MHPADVAEFVADRVDDLRRTLEKYPDLGVSSVCLEDSLQLYVAFRKEDYKVVVGAVPSGIFAQSGVQFAKAVEVPLLGAPRTTRELLLHLDCTDFDTMPPSANLLRVDRTQLPEDEWPAMGHGGIIRGHRAYNRPVFCRSGLREYHSHLQHEDDPWDKYRESVTLTGIVLGLLEDMRGRWGGKA
jgi:hypothetical protein